MSTNEGLQVVGAGQMRTGTTSLHAALQYLYKGKCYHMRDVVDNSHHIKLWQKSVDANQLKKETATELFMHNVAAVDYPSSVFYRDMLELYPNAKVILTVRDVDSWIRSVRQTTIPKYPPSLFSKILVLLTNDCGFVKVRDCLIEKSLGRPIAELRRDNVLKECYLKYYVEVKATVPSDRMLIFDNDQGWPPLCKFLCKSIPDIPYPNLNNANEFRRNKRIRFRYRLIKGLLPFVIFGGVIISVIFAYGLNFFY